MLIGVSPTLKEFQCKSLSDTGSIAYRRSNEKSSRILHGAGCITRPTVPQYVVALLADIVRYKLMVEYTDLDELLDKLADAGRGDEASRLQAGTDKAIEDLRAWVTKLQAENAQLQQKFDDSFKAQVEFESANAELKRKLLEAVGKAENWKEQCETGNRTSEMLQSNASEEIARLSREVTRLTECEDLLNQEVERTREIARRAWVRMMGRGPLDMEKCEFLIETDNLNELRSYIGVWLRAGDERQGVAREEKINARNWANYLDNKDGVEYVDDGGKMPRRVETDFDPEDYRV